MTVPVASSLSQRSASVPGWLPAALVLLATALIGPSLGGLSRPLFVAACGAVGWYAWRCSAAAHLQAAIILFSFAPMVRRMVDAAIGFDPTGFMLVGPLAAILAPLPYLRPLLDGDRSLGRQTAPMLLVAGCIAYVTMLTLFQGEWLNAASGALKWLAPLLYAATIITSADRDELVQAAASAFVVILPITGLIGLFQYIDPPAWDRYWMQFAPILSVGQPVPYGVRTFSSMNAPASFATFTAAGLLLVCFLRNRWYLPLVAIPAALAFLLSLYRTAWLSLAVGVLFCLLFSGARIRALVILLGILFAALAAATMTPFGEVIADRLSTLGQVGSDDSAQERLEQYVLLWNTWDSSLFGVGFTTSDVGSPGAMAVDGMIIACWLLMGIMAGLVCLFALMWAIGNTITAPWRDLKAETIMIGALGCGALVQLPLANITAGETGFLFWTFAALAAMPPGSRVHGAP
ncbi:MAG: O-antigen ligase family protein [Hyphomicrobiales bacterium]|nr:O-antigen ligase family protein [Hyphomicrobiales bacterium]